MAEKKDGNENKPDGNEKAQSKDSKPTCNIIMPISAMDTYSAEHWGDVLSILRDVIEDAGFTGDLVSNADEVNVIHKTIVQNVYNSDIVICDASGKNPNVMFELGLRLAFDKATIIIKDEITPFLSDTSPIEHLIYPRDLRFQKIVDFKKRLKAKIIATHEAAKDSTYSTFLKHFGQFKVAHLESKEVSSDVYILESLKELTKEVHSLRSVVPVTDKELMLATNKTSLHSFYKHKFMWMSPVPLDAELKSRIANLLRDKNWIWTDMEVSTEAGSTYLDITFDRVLSGNEVNRFVKDFKETGYVTGLAIVVPG